MAVATIPDRDIEYSHRVRLFNQTFQCRIHQIRGDKTRIPPLQRTACPPSRYAQPLTSYPPMSTAGSHICGRRRYESIFRAFQLPSSRSPCRRAPRFTGGYRRASNMSRPMVLTNQRSVNTSRQLTGALSEGPADVSPSFRLHPFLSCATPFLI